MAAKRRRCTGPLHASFDGGKGKLFDPSELARVDTDWYCVECVAIEAATRADTAEPQEAKDERIAAIRERLDLPDPEKTPLQLEAERVLEKNAMSEEGAPGSSGATPEAVAEAGEAATVASPADLLPAPSAQPVLNIDLGDPEEAMERRHDMPNPVVEGWPLTYGRISASALGQFMRCPEQFRRSRILGEKEAPSGALISGATAHTGLEVAYRYRMHEQEAPKKVIKEWMDAKFEHEVSWASKSGLGVKWGSEKQPSNAGHAIMRARGAVEQYVAQIVPSFRPISTEEAFTIEVYGCPVPLVGVTDMIADVEPNAGLLGKTRQIVDFKFGSRVHSTADQGWILQGLLYLLAYDLPMTWHSVGWPKKDGQSSIHTPLSTDGLILRRDAASFQRAGNIVRTAVQSILAYNDRFGPDEPWLGNITHPYVCAICDFSSTCPFVTPQVEEFSL